MGLPTRSSPLRAAQGHLKRGQQSTGAIDPYQGIEQRGSFKDPFCGESFSQLKDDGTGKTGPVQWSSYLTKCEAWRKKTYGGKYKISDKIP